MKNYLLSSVCFAPDDGGAAAKPTKQELANEERSKIDVTVTSKTGEEDEIKEENEDGKDADDETDENKEKDETTEDEKADDVDEPTKEEVKAKTKEERRQDRIQRRIDKVTAEAKAAKAEVESLKRQLAAKPDDEKVLTEDEVEKRAEAKALQKAAERAFVADCNKLADEAEKEDKDFSKKIDALTEDVGPIPGHMIGILSDLDNGGKVLSYLANNEDEAEDLWKLSPAKMALKLSRISDKLNAKPKKEISKAPVPNKGLGGKGGQSEVLHDKMDMRDWVELRNKQVAERNALKRNSYR